MKWFDKWFYKQSKKVWENKNRFEMEAEEVPIKQRGLNMATVGAQAISRGLAEGENRISFELTSAVGGKILNVRHYDDRKDRHETQTYVIPTGEDIGERVAKIINLEMFKQ